MADLERELEQRLATAFERVAGAPADPAVHRSRHADYQADGALALARTLRRSPREVAAAVLAAADLGDLAVGELAGPGFINLTVSGAALSRLADEVLADPRLAAPLAATPQTVVVDYSAPNAAKQMHVGHLRSTVIGDAIVRLQAWFGHTVIRQNHLGDWGTPFGMLIEHLLDVGEDEAAHELSLGDLNAFYQAARKKFDADEAFADRSRARVVLLQGGDADTGRLWQVLIEASIAYFMNVYAELGITLTEEDFAGESVYNDELGPVIDELAAKGLLEESDGALCVFPPGFVNRDGDRMPLIVRKRDGGYGYDTTDLATLRRRVRVMHADRLLYVVGLPQSLHFEMIFAAARQAGWLGEGEGEGVRAEHVGFGSVLGPDGKMLRTRAGAAIKLSDLLGEAVGRALSAVQEKTDLPAEEAEAVARAVGIGAIKYADLSTDRGKDYVFDYDRMLSFDGNTAPYLQYAHARIRSILRRASVDDPAGPIAVREPAERELALELLAFGGLVTELQDTLELHKLCTYLFGLASAFTGFYEQCPVLKSSGEVRESRLALCALTARTLAQGLDLLGIEAPDRM